MDILTVLLLTTHGHVISFHLFVSTSVSFTWLVKLIPKVFFCLFCFWIGYHFFISLPDSLLLLHTDATDFHNLNFYPQQFIINPGEGNGNPLQCCCLANPRDRTAWWAAIYGVTQSQTQLRWLSSSSSSNIVMTFLIYLYKILYNHCNLQNWL